MKEDKNKKGVVYRETNTIIDTDSGEVKKVEQDVIRYVGTRKKFMRVFVEDIGAIIGLKSKTDYDVLLAIWKEADFSTNRIILVKEIKEQIAKLIECKSIRTIENSITRLVKKDLLVRSSSSVYYLNPKYFFKGFEDEHKNALEFVLKLKYKIGNEENEDKENT